MLKLSLEAIQIIDAIARHGSFSAAAEELHKVPSTISYSVARLEEQLGMQLFDRLGQGVALTRVGAELLNEGRWLVQAAGDLESRLRRVASGFEAELRLVHDAMIPGAALIPDIAAFEALQCGTRLRLSSETMTGSWEALKDCRADLVIAAGEGPSGGGYQAVPVGTLDFAFCVGPSHPLAAQPQPLSSEVLRLSTAIVIADSARSLPSRTIGLLSGQARLTVGDIRTKIALQVAGLGHGFLPRALVARELAEGTLVELTVAEAKPLETFWLAWRPGEQGAALQWWRDRLKRPLLPGLLEAH